MAGVEVKVSLTPEEFDLLRKCVELTGCVVSALNVDEMRRELLQERINLDRLEFYLKVGRRKGNR